MTDIPALASAAVLPVQLFNLGLIYQNRNEMPQAEQCYRRALDYAPLYADAWNNLGIIAHNCNHLRVAIDLYIKALECNPRFGPSWGNLGAVFESCGRLREAIKVYEIGLAIEERPEILSNMAGICRELGDFPAAHRHYARALALKPGPNHVHIHSAWVFTSDQDPTSTLAQRAAIKAAFRKGLST